jgi:hypothetical protein
MSDGYLDTPTEFRLGGQALPGCQESGCGLIVSPPGFLTGVMQFIGAGNNRGQGIG